MLIKVRSAANYGINTIGVDIEVNVASKGFPSFDIVGLPSKAVAESKERVRTALINSGIEFPIKKITVNLAPADLPKEGSFYDLPIAVGIISAITGIEFPQDALFYGELSLDGSLRHTKGTFLLALYAKEGNIGKIYVPKASSKEASVIKGVDTIPVKTLSQLFDHLSGENIIFPLPISEDDLDVGDEAFKFDMKEVIGQEQAKRALEISAAGGHNVLLIGPPGGGKTMLARSMPSILPSLTIEEALEVTKIFSSSGNIPPGGGLVTTRGCRSPHHTISYAGLIGGGTSPSAGEISHAHRGVLFLDEFAEFPRRVIESLRQPMEDGIVTISRSSGSVTFPCRFILIAASNPCPCGYLHHPVRQCGCSPHQIVRYLKKISGPILDRIDLHVYVHPVSIDSLSSSGVEIQKGERSSEIRERVVLAREVQYKRFSRCGIFANSEMRNKHIRKYCQLSKCSESILKKAAIKYSLSARAYFKIIKVSRTIADLADEEEIKDLHVSEALQYRN